MGIVNTTDSNFDSEVQTTGAVLVDLWAPWCNPCLALAPHLDKLAEKTGANLKIVKINVDDNPEVMKKFGVRGIPTLIFMVDGKEEGRLVGTSANRLNVTVEKWMTDRGLPVGAELPSGADAALAGEQEPPAGTPRRQLLSFGDDPAIKAATLVRLGAIADPEQMPSKYLAESAEQLEDTLGLPVQVAALIDLMWSMNFAFDLQPFAQMRDDTVALVDAIPVGVDLGSIPAQLQYHATYLSPWSVMQYSMTAEETAAVGAARLLHERELSGETVPQATWAALQKRVILLPDADGGGKVSQELEHLCLPLGGEHFMAALTVLMRLAQGDVRRAPHWTEADAKRAYEFEMAFYAALEAALGPRPTEEDPAIATWKASFEALLKKSNADKRSADPVFWERSDQYRDVVASIEKDMYGYLRAQILALFAATKK